MATYTAYLSPLRSAGPYVINDVTVFVVSADAVILDENDVFMDQSGEGPSNGLVTIYSNEPVEASDDMSDLRRKVTENVFANFDWMDPEVDTILYKFM